MSSRFHVGDHVTVKVLDPPGHNRTPPYVRGKEGVVERVHGSFNCRRRVVKDPPGVLGEMGLQLSPDTGVRVVDSAADIRYLVIPKRPPGTDGMTEGQLADLVTRDSMIGVAQARRPGQ